jgi:hypothetical protein
MPLAQAIQGSPAWLEEYTRNLVDRSRQLNSERYFPYRQVSQERNDAIRGEIDRLLQLQRGDEGFDIIPFSITGNSKPININPINLRNIIQDEGFARRLYESATGHGASRGELQDLRDRAERTFQSFRPEISRLEPEIERRERERNSRQEHLHGLQSQMNELQGHERSLMEEDRVLGAEISRITHESGLPALKKHVRGLRGEREALVLQQQQQQGVMVHPRQRQRLIEQIAEKDREIEEDVRRGNEISHNLAPLKQRFQQIKDSYVDIRNRMGALSSQLSQPSSEPPEDIFKRASSEREIHNLQGERGRIAPMNEIHDRAISMLERGFNDDTMSLAANELREAKKHNELRSVEPLVRSSLEGPSDQYMDKYVHDYTKDLRKALEDESEEQYLEHIAPKINMSFAQMGAFHSGARAKALRDSLSKHRVKLHREIAHLTAGARDKAMEHHELQKRREQSAAHLLGHTTKSEKEGARHHAELLRNQAVTKHSLSQLDAAALGQVAKAKQEQRQHEIDVERQEHERQLLHPHEQLGREAAFVHGLPPPASQTVSGSLGPGPTPPNLFNLGAGTLAALSSGFGNQQQQRNPYKKGGSVRKNYAHGGHIGTDDIGKEIRNIINEQRQSDKSRLQEASGYDPIQGIMRHVGREMLSNPSKNPLLNVGMGISNAMDHRDLMKERSSNLYDKIQSSRLNQYQVLAAYENMKHKQNLHEKQFGLQREKMELARHNSNQLNQMRMSSLSKNSLDQIEKRKPLSASERKTEIEAKKELLRAIRMKKEVGHLGKLVEKTSSGPIIGSIKSILPRTKVDNQIEVATNKLILDMHQGMKNIPRSEEFMKRIETTKPNRTNYPEANKEALDLMSQGANDVEEHSISTLLSMGWTPERIEKQFKVKVPEHFLEEDGQETPEEEHEENDVVHMIDPSGNTREVPLSDVEEALELGARYA